MTSPDLWQLAAGTVQGTQHRDTHHPNQDAFAHFNGLTFSVGIVCDGCSSSPHSELGARMGAEFLVNDILEISNHNPECDRDEAGHLRLLDWAFWSFRTYLSQVARTIDPYRVRGGIADYLLFTVVGFIATRDWVTVFSCGDGFYGVNGDFKAIGPFPANRPPYPVYSIMDESNLPGINFDSLRFETQFSAPLEQVDSLLIATDGLAALPAETGLMSSLLHPPDALFATPLLLERQLRVLNAERHKPDWEARTMRVQKGPLFDDTTIIVAKKPQRKENHDRP